MPTYTGCKFVVVVKLPVVADRQGAAERLVRRRPGQVGAGDVTRPPHRLAVEGHEHPCQDHRARLRRVQVGVGRIDPPAALQRRIGEQLDALLGVGPGQVHRLSDAGGEAGGDLVGEPAIEVGRARMHAAVGKGLVDTRLPAVGPLGLEVRIADEATGHEVEQLAEARVLDPRPGRGVDPRPFVELPARLHPIGGVVVEAVVPVVPHRGAERALVVERGVVGADQSGVVQMLLAQERPERRDRGLAGVLLGVDGERDPLLQVLVAEAERAFVGLDEPGPVVAALLGDQLAGGRREGVGHVEAGTPRVRHLRRNGVGQSFLHRRKLSLHKAIERIVDVVHAGRVQSQAKGRLAGVLAAVVGVGVGVRKTAHSGDVQVR